MDISESIYGPVRTGEVGIGVAAIGRLVPHQVAGDVLESA